MNLGITQYLWCSLALIGFVLWLTWRRQAVTTGLPLCYLLALGTIHLVGAWVSTLGSAPSDNRAAVLAGFRECVIGASAFVVGWLAVETAMTWRTPNSSNANARAGAEASGSRSKSRLPFAAWYLVTGAILLGAVTPWLKGVPTVGALANCGGYLLVAGVCLRCWQAYYRGDRGNFMAWAGASLLFPLFTMLTMGFIGYGALAALMVLAFGMVHYRPRWHAVIGLALTMYLGLSVYVTYMRDRTELREVVWGGESYRARLETLGKMFHEFEFFNPGKESHLRAVDERLNQNALAGAAVNNLDSGAVEFARGETLLQAMAALVPRAVWPARPVRAGSPELVSRYSGIDFEPGTSVGVGQVMEFYINFGRWGIMVGFFVYGVMLRLMDWKAGAWLARGDEERFARWYVPGLAFMQAGGSLVEVAGTAAALVVLVWTVNIIGRLWLLGPGPSGPELRNGARRA